MYTLCKFLYTSADFTARVSTVTIVLKVLTSCLHHPWVHTLCKTTCKLGRSKQSNTVILHSYTIFPYTFMVIHIHTEVVQIIFICYSIVTHNNTAWHCGVSLSKCMFRTWTKQLHAHDCYQNVTEDSTTLGHRILHEVYIYMHCTGNCGFG